MPTTRISKPEEVKNMTIRTPTFLYTFHTAAGVCQGGECNFGTWGMYENCEEWRRSFVLLRTHWESLKALNKLLHSRVVAADVKDRQNDESRSAHNVWRENGEALLFKSKGWEEEVGHIFGSLLSGERDT
ncbi:MAG: hypothetical protein Q9170_004671 [Blastenia crenularia]